jgi:heme exporter protein B
MTHLLTLLRYEIRHYWRGSGSALLSLGCYFILIFLLGYTTQNSLSMKQTMDTISVTDAFQWIAMILSALLAIERIWLDDFRDHLIPQQRLSPYPLFVLMAVKLKAFWLCIFLPLLLVFAGQYYMTHGNLSALAILPFFLASISVTLLLLLAGVLGLGSTNGLLVGLVIILPLLIPPLTFGLGAQLAIQQQLSPWPALSLLTAYILFNLVLVPIAVHYIIAQQRS